MTDACAFYRLVYSAATFLAIGLGTFGTLADGAAPGGKLKMGRWVGHVSLEGREEAFAATLDTLTVQPDDAAEFPYLGGMHTWLEETP